jgi:hypothetical protein
LKQTEKKLTAAIEKNARISAHYRELLQRAADETIVLSEKLAEVRSQLDTERADRQLVTAQLASKCEELDRTRAELASLCEEVEKLKENPPGAIDLSDKAGEVVNFFRTLLPKDAKLPKNTMSKLREILETTED